MNMVVELRKAQPRWLTVSELEPEIIFQYGNETGPWYQKLSLGRVYSFETGVILPEDKFIMSNVYQTLNIGDSLIITKVA